MYSATDSIVRSIKIADINKKLIDSAYDSMIENMKLMQGITPVPVEDRPSPFQNREEVMAAIKTITYEPRKFFAMLYDAYQVDLFAQRLPEFLRYIGKYRTNLSAEKLYSEWQRFITLTIDKDLEVKGVPKEEVDAYDTAVNPFKDLKTLQGANRTKIRLQGFNTTKLKELEQIEKKMKEMSKEIVKANIMGDTDKWTKLDDEFMKLDKRRKTLLKSIELETAKQSFNPNEEMREKFERSVSTVQRHIREREQEPNVISRAVILSQIERIDNELNSMERYIDQSEGKISKKDMASLVKKEEKLQAEKSRLNNMLHNY